MFIALLYCKAGSISVLKYIGLLYRSRGRHDRMVVRFITTYAIIAYHH